MHRSRHSVNAKRTRRSPVGASRHNLPLYEASQYRSRADEVRPGVATICQCIEYYEMQIPRSLPGY
jgi:hypothetical protein